MHAIWVNLFIFQRVKHTDVAKRGRDLLVKEFAKAFEIQYECKTLCDYHFHHVQRQTKKKSTNR